MKGDQLWTGKGIRNSSVVKTMKRIGPEQVDILMSVAFVLSS